MALGETTKSSSGSPFYLFEDPSKVVETGWGQGERTALLDLLREDYDWRAPFLEWDDTAHALNRDMFPSSQQFYLGGTGTGAPIHFHSDAWNVCAYGQRRWFLFKPEHATYSKIPMKEWIEKDYPKLAGRAKPLECMQQAGDVLFVPQHWGHGTFNVQESVGLAVELNHVMFDCQFF